MKKFYIIFIAIFTIINSTTAQKWVALGSGANKAVLAMKSYNNGLIVGGNFDTINSVRSQCLAYYKYTGSSYFWSDELAKGYKTSSTYSNFNSAYIDAIEIFDGRVHIGGEYFHPYYFSNLNIGYLTYDSFGPSWDFEPYYDFMNQPAYALKSYNNKLYLGGNFTNFVGTNYVAGVNSMDYPSPIPHTLGNGLNGRVYCFEVFNGNLYAGGTFTSSGTTTLQHLAKWDGSQWTDVGGGVNGTVTSLTVFNNELIVGGNFTLAGSTTAKNIAKWNGSAWSALGSGLSSSSSSSIVYALKSYNNKLYAGGSFNISNTTTLQNITKWDGATWASLGSGVNNTIKCLEVANAKLFVGGDFTTANGLTANHIAYYDDFVIGISELNNLEVNFNVMPNPASNTITIEIPKVTKGSTLTVYNVNGQKVMCKTIMGIKTQLDINDLKKGVYFVEVVTIENKNTIIKVIKE